MNTRKKSTVRCAIYTRKSTEEGLEQEFNWVQLVLATHGHAAFFMVNGLIG